MDLNNIPVARKQLVTTQQKVTFMNHLHKIVSKHCPLNKVGTPVVSDYDKLDATAEEQLEALMLTLSPK